PERAAPSRRTWQAGGTARCVWVLLPACPRCAAVARSGGSHEHGRSIHEQCDWTPRQVTAGSPAPYEHRLPPTARPGRHGSAAPLWPGARPRLSYQRFRDIPPAWAATVPAGFPRAPSGALTVRQHLHRRPDISSQRWLVRRFLVVAGPAAEPPPGALAG